jgi:hypothetical protein
MSPDSAPATVTIVVSQTVEAAPPLVTLTIPKLTGNNGWFKTKPVLVTVSASDPVNVTAISCKSNGAAVEIGSLKGIGTPSASGTISRSTDGVYALVCLATNGAGLTGAAAGSTNTGTVQIDTKVPTVKFGSVIFEKTYPLNAVVTVNYTCLDEQSGVATCVGQVPSGAMINTSSVGKKTFTIVTSDKAGNATTVLRTYTVQ